MSFDIEGTGNQLPSTGGTMTDAFRPMRHSGVPMPSNIQREIFAALGDSWFYPTLIRICEGYSTRDAYRLADKLQQRWRKAGLIKYGDGKWYKVKP